MSSQSPGRGNRTAPTARALNRRAVRRPGAAPNRDVRGPAPRPCRACVPPSVLRVCAPASRKRLTGLAPAPPTLPSRAAPAARTRLDQRSPQIPLFPGPPQHPGRESGTARRAAKLPATRADGAPHPGHPLPAAGPGGPVRLRRRRAMLRGR